MEGNLVRLRAIKEDDYYSIGKWLTPSIVSSLGRGANDFVQVDDLKKDIENGRTQYAMVLTHDDERIGFVSWEPLKYEGNYMLGGIIGDQEKWDNGYGAEASLLIMDYLFHQKNAHKIQFINGLYNLRSVRFLIKNGVVVEGILRDHFFVDGEFHDAVISSVLREEYYQDPNNHPLDTIPSAEKEKVRKEIYEYLNSHWKEWFLWNGKVK